MELNRAVALAMAFGPAAGLELVDELTAEPALQGYHLLPSVRGDLLAKLGRFEEARAEFERAAVADAERARARAAAQARGRLRARGAGVFLGLGFNAAATRSGDRRSGRSVRS